MNLTRLFYFAMIAAPLFAGDCHIVTADHAFDLTPGQPEQTQAMRLPGFFGAPGPRIKQISGAVNARGSDGNTGAAVAIMSRQGGQELVQARSYLNPGLDAFQQGRARIPFRETFGENVEGASIDPLGRSLWIQAATFDAPGDLHVMVSVRLEYCYPGERVRASR